MHLVSQKVFAIALLISPILAYADQWIPYTDGRAGGCFLNNVGHLYGCTPQPQQPQQNIGTRDSGEYLSQNFEDSCRKERQRLKNANSDFNRTVTSMRKAEERFERTGCEK